MFGKNCSDICIDRNYNNYSDSPRAVFQERRVRYEEVSH